MSGNTLGRIFTLTTFGESHGACIGGIVDGCPPGMPLSESDLQHNLDRRRPGQSQYTTQRQEPDRVQILSGVFEGVTTGTPIGLMIENKDAKPKDYTNIAHTFRPGHADYTYAKKYGIRDYRGGGRASARETAIRVAAGGIAQKYLKLDAGLTIYGYLAQIGPLALTFESRDVIEKNPFFCPNLSQIQAIEALIQDARKEGDSLGARITLIAEGVPVGLGEPVFDKLNADLAHAMMSIPAVRGVEIGDGFGAIAQRGSHHRDEITQSGFLSNHAGGILGGISTGQSLLVSIALKPTSSLPTPAQSIDLQGNPVEIRTQGRHDPCVGLRAVAIAEAMLACVLMDHLLRHRAQNAKTVNDDSA